ncbi:MAG TPA: LuxR C-terminal-related transcriptional regulator [Acidimicrobiales bacterium]|nr:LuxR C-terminal-related transcriptional regulator [Acidimicrobiales bacterium]
MSLRDIDAWGDHRKGSQDADGFVLVTTKLRPPRLRSRLVLRQRLLEQLSREPGPRLTLLAAPAGFGKTSILAAWHASRPSELPTAWLTVDRNDNDPVVFWSYVMEALRRVCPHIDDSVPVGAPMVIELMLPRLINALDAEPTVTLVLDDFYALTAGPSRDSLAWLLDQAPPSFHLVISTRREPDLPLHALRAHDELLELRADDLRFTTQECDELLNRREQLALSPADIRLLVERTAGWPAGLYLAALSLRNAGDRHDLVARFGASNRHVVDFLEAEVMAAHDLADREFLVRCSVLERMCGPLCDEVLQSERSAETLARLSRANLFLVPEDDDDGWYRFHPLFAQLLRVELRRGDPGLEAALHLRASVWYRDHGSMADAVDHAIAAELYDEAADLVASCWVEYGNSCRDATVESWLDRFPEDIMAGDPRLLLAEGWLQWLSGRHREVFDTIERVEAIVAADPDRWKDDSTEVEGSLLTLKATVPREHDDDDELLGERAVAVCPPGSLWRPVACWATGLERYGRGELIEADRWFAETLELAPATGQWLVGGASLGYRSLIAGERGDKDLQVRFAEEAMEFMRAHGLDDVGVDAWHAAGLALVAQGKLAEARPVLARSVAVSRFRGQRVLVARALRSYAHVLRLLGEPGEAASAEAEATSILASTPDYRGLASPARVLRRVRRMRALPGNETLTQRELIVLELLATDRSEADIARELFVSHSTVHSHTRSIHRKLGVSTRAEVLRRAREIGLL